LFFHKIWFSVKQTFKSVTLTPIMAIYLKIDAKNKFKSIKCTERPKLGPCFNFNKPLGPFRYELRSTVLVYKNKNKD
jgi:hypothetical protein